MYILTTNKQIVIPIHNLFKTFQEVKNYCMLKKDMCKTGLQSFMMIIKELY